MTMNRRNVLIGLGATAAGGGAILGSGAFSQVIAERSVSATVVADDSGNANLGLSPNNTDIATMNGNQLELSVDSLNENAKTVFDTVFTIDNNGPNGVGIQITPYDSTDTEITDGSLSFTSDASGHDLTSFPSASGDDHNLDQDGGTDETVVVGMTLDDTVGDPTQLSYIEIEADASQYQA